MQAALQCDIRDRVLPSLAPVLQALQRQPVAERPDSARYKPTANQALWHRMQGQQPKQQLARRNNKGWLEPMIFEQGKAAVLNIQGPYVLYRDGLGVSSLKQLQPLIKVSSIPVVGSLCTAAWLPCWHGAGELIGRNLL